MPNEVPDAHIRRLLDGAYRRYATSAFVEHDPLQVPRSFATRSDAEVIGFLTATIAWGQRRTTIANAWRLVRLMEGEPGAFVDSASARELAQLASFVHRTFNGTDLRQFVLGLRHLRRAHGGMEESFLLDGTVGDMGTAIARFKARFFEPRHPARTRKHVADPSRGSNAKRINMFLRWMVRTPTEGVDLGLWTRIRPADLMVPLDVHTGRVARELGLLTRAQDDWKSVVELTENLRQLDPVDPVKYDLALFGLGVNGALSAR
ncbi:MAG TPA: TIGR02757 family protein [Flavobacteriales bacterium]|nr:TIGR02757 family protein [Flavobacteriales bacterium]HQW86203.1 TIGR02757 family protein [Flavobacteriales bacterium]